MALAPTKLQIYNDALLLLGERPLDTITDAVEARYRLDSAWGLGAVDYCLELVQPRFAVLVEKMTSVVTDPDHGYTNVYDLSSATYIPNQDYLKFVGLFSDSGLNQPIERNFRDGNTLACNYSTVYFRYVASSVTVTPSAKDATGYDTVTMTAAFLKVITAYLARELAVRLDSDDLERMNGLFDDRVSAARELDKQDEAIRRPEAPTGTLTSDWLKIYDDALNILGLEKLTNGDDDSHRRSVLDTSVDSGIVGAIFEDAGWHFASTTTKSEYNPSIEPDFGPRYAHNYPADWHNFIGVWADEDFTTPLPDYVTENNIIYSYQQEIFIQYVTNSFLTAPAEWPRVYQRYIAAQMAKDSIASLPTVNSELVERVWKQRKRDARSWDAQNSPPRKLTAGNWSRARLSGSNRNRFDGGGLVG